MPTILQILAQLEAVAKLVGPTVEPIIIAQLEKLKAGTTNAAEIALIESAEALITSYLQHAPTGA